MISSLPPKSFPAINLSNFKISQSSVSSTTNRTAFPDYNNVKFMSKQNAIPDLFQYNDREKLILSSDEEQEHQPSFYFEDEKAESQYLSEFNTDYNDTVKKCKNLNVKEQSNKETHQQSKPIKQVKIQKKNQQRHEANVILQEKQQEIDQIKITKAQVKTKNFTINKLQSNISQITIVPIKIVQPHIQKETQIESRIPQQTFVTSQKSYLNQSMSRYQQTVKKNQFKPHQKQQMFIIQQQRHSNTYHILERIQSDKNTINLASQSDHRQDNLQNVQEPQNLTPRKRKRNKIFDKSSIRRQPNYLNSQKTPQKGVQIVEQSQKQIKRQEDKKKDLFPQIKALNILDKLVDQIGNQNQNQKHYSNNHEKDTTLNLNELNNFNKQLLNEILALQNITCITELNQQHFEQKVKILQQKIQKWNNQLQCRSILLLNNQIYKKFNRLSDMFSIIMIVITQYKQTFHKLEHFQKKLENYVIILRDKDTKRLYLLRRDLSVQLEFLNQLKAGCGISKLQKMFSEYLSTQIKLLEQIKQGIDDNFDNHSTIFKF